MHLPRRLTCCQSLDEVRRLLRLYTGLLLPVADCQAAAALAPARVDDGPPAHGLHPCEEAMLAQARTLLGLIGSLRH